MGLCSQFALHLPFAFPPPMPSVSPSPTSNVGRSGASPHFTAEEVEVQRGAVTLAKAAQLVGGRAGLEPGPCYGDTSPSVLSTESHCASQSCTGVMVCARQPNLPSKRDTLSIVCLSVCLSDASATSSGKWCWPWTILSHFQKPLVHDSTCIRPRSVKCCGPAS